MNLLKLENQVCFPLYAASRQITALYRPLLEELGLTYPQYLVMLVLWEHSVMTVKELGELLFLDSGTLTPLLKRLEEKGIVKRSRDEQDERVVNIALTAAGKRMEKSAEKIPTQLAGEMDMSEKELKQLRATLYKLLNKVGHI
ncbi:MarR family transcriptional regulator [Chitinophaga sp.]|uniref:MarR family winged helix-turn-helix transcriptional regulator n=1 Tax=Chitinophaga sp. TaxID=1869181 RepID=UPI0031CEF8EB